MSSTYVQHPYYHSEPYRQHLQIIMDTSLPSPPRSPGRSRTPSPKDGAAPSQKPGRNDQSMLKALPANQTISRILKSILRKDKAITRPKSLSWNADVIDNAGKPRLLPARMLPSRPTLSTSDFRTAEATHSRPQLPQQQKYHHAAPQKQSTPPVKWTPPAVLDPPARRPQLRNPSPGEPSKSVQGKATMKRSESVQQTPAKPPPTPRPQRLPTPDLPELNQRPFCACCPPGPHSAPRIEQSKQALPKQKYEKQCMQPFFHIMHPHHFTFPVLTDLDESAVIHIQNSKRR